VNIMVVCFTSGFAKTLTEHATLSQLYEYVDDIKRGCDLNWTIGHSHIIIRGSGGQFFVTYEKHVVTTRDIAKFDTAEEALNYAGRITYDPPNKRLLFPSKASALK
jgi:hypothetical protein